MNAGTEKEKIFWGWFIVAGAFIILSISYGSKYCFGIFVKPMFAEYRWPMSVISLGASINFIMYAAGGIVSGRLLDRMAPKWIMTIGSIVTAVGFILTSFVTTPVQLYLSYGVLCGLGASGIGVVVASSSVGKWFVRKRGIAVGIASMGIGFGTMLLTPTAGYIVKHYDWRYGFLFFGVLVCVIGVALSQMLMRRTNPEAYGLVPDGRRTNPVIMREPIQTDISPNMSLMMVLKDSRFWIPVICFSIAVMVEMMAFVHQVTHALNHNIDKITAASSIGFIGVASIFGRFFFGWFSDRLRDPKYSASLGFLVMAVGMVILLNTTSVGFLYVYAIVFGFGYGSLAPMMPVLLADRFGRHVLGSAYGWLTFFVVGFGGGLGPVLGGFIYDTSGSYAYAWQFNLVTLVIVTLIMLMLKPGNTTIN